MKKMKLILAAIFIIVLLAGCTQKEEEVIRMGFVPMRDGDKLIESVQPLAEMLTKELGVKVEAFTATNYVGVVEAMGSGEVDFGIIPPFAYVLANKESEAQVVLTAINKHGGSSYKSQFLVSTDSEIATFEDIRGKKLAFVDPSSSSGYLFPGAHLKGEGIDLENELEYIYAGGHDKALQLLLNGDVDVATTFVDAREKYLKDFPNAIEATSVLGYTRDIPNISVTVRGDMDEALRVQIKEALMTVSETEEGSTLFRELFNMYGFVEATDADYDVIRDTAAEMDVDLRN